MNEITLAAAYEKGMKEEEEMVLVQMAIMDKIHNLINEMELNQNMKLYKLGEQYE